MFSGTINLVVDIQCRAGILYLNHNIRQKPAAEKMVQWITLAPHEVAHSITETIASVIGEFSQLHLEVYPSSENPNVSLAKVHTLHLLYLISAYRQIPLTLKKYISQSISDYLQT